MVLFKNRYLVLEMVWHGHKWVNATLSPAVVTSAIHESLLLNFGEHGLASCVPSLQVKYVNAGTGVCIVRCSRQQYHMVWAAITFITHIRNLPVLFNLLDLSGSIGACRRASMQYDTEKLRQLKLNTDTPLLKEQLELAEPKLSRLAYLEG